jgi:hypothetical protein
MTNEELLVAIRQIVREELANTRPNSIEPDDLIIAGPDENARVKFAGTDREKEGVWVISILTLRQSLAGKIPPLTMQQLASIMMNVGCDEHGNLQPAAFRGYGQTGVPENDQITPFTNKVVPAPTFWQPYAYKFGDPFPMSDEERTIGSRSENIKTLIKSVQGIGKLHANDGSSFVRS